MVESFFLAPKPEETHTTVDAAEGENTFEEGRGDYDEWEESDDIVYIEVHKDEPAIPFEEVVREFEEKHGPLY